MSDAVFLILLILHVGAIVAWMGGATLFISVVSPSLRRMTPTSRSEFVLSAFPPYMRFIGGSSIVSVTAGLVLYAYITQIATSLAPTGSGLIYIQIGAVVSLFVLLIAFGVIIPTGRKVVRMLKESQRQADVDPTKTAQMTSLQKRLAMGARLGVSLLALTLILMIIGASI